MDLGAFREKSLLVLLVKRFSILLFIWLSALVFLYGVGNRQLFLEKNLIFLYRSIIISAPMLAFISLVGFLIDLFLLLYTRKKHYLLGVFAYIFLLTFSLALLFFGNALELFTGGNPF